jgi:hypothetical protein
LDELEIALMSLKRGKAAGFDGIYPVFIENVGARRWFSTSIKDWSNVR